ncbi:MAG: hypothetical protein AAGB00_13435 [Planctomycetota bacterium]
MGAIALAAAARPSSAAAPLSSDQPAGADGADAKPAGRLGELLDLVGWPAERVAAFAAKEGLSEPEEVELVELALRLRSLKALVVSAADTGDPAAAIVRGRAQRVLRVTLSNEAAARLGVKHYYACDLQPEGAGAAAVRVLTLRVPNDWLAGGTSLQTACEGTPEATPDQPAEATGAAFVAAGGLRIVVAPEVRWFPEAGAGVKLGQAVLGGAGFDVGMLDLAVDGGPLLARESALFYELLVATRQTGARQLARFARGNLAEYARGWADREDALSRAVRQQAAAGRYSVAPLFNDAKRQRGELFVFDGVVRRVLRVEVGPSEDGLPSQVAQRYGIDHYYELELFPADSQNLPLVFCVLELPEGCPIGPRLARDARVAGFFLKRWAYGTRKPGAEGSRSHDKRQVAPLLIGRAPILLAPPAGVGVGFEIATGLAFAAAVLAIVGAVWWFGQADQAFEDQLRKRFAPAEPPNFDALSAEVVSLDTDADCDTD